MPHIEENIEIEKINEKFQNQFDKSLEDKLDYTFFQSIDTSLILSGYPKSDIIKSYRLNTVEKAELAIVELEYLVRPIKGISSYNSETRAIGFKKLRSSYGHIIIRPETLEDKLRDIFEHSDIDFKEFPKFSSKYFFVSSDKSLANLFATPQRLKRIEQCNEIFIEIQDNVLLSKFSRKINLEDFAALNDFIKEI